MPKASEYHDRTFAAGPVQLPVLGRRCFGGRSRESGASGDDVHCAGRGAHGLGPATGRSRRTARAVVYIEIPGYGASRVCVYAAKLRAGERALSGFVSAARRGQRREFVERERASQSDPGQPDRGWKTETSDCSDAVWIRVSADVASRVGSGCDEAARRGV